MCSTFVAVSARWLPHAHARHLCIFFASFFSVALFLCLCFCSFRFFVKRMFGARICDGFDFSSLILQSLFEDSGRASQGFVSVMAPIWHETKRQNSATSVSVNLLSHMRIRFALTFSSAPFFPARLSFMLFPHFRGWYSFTLKLTYRGRRSNPPTEGSERTMEESKISIEQFKSKFRMQ